MTTVLAWVAGLFGIHAHQGNRRHSLDLRGFSMTRAEAAMWLDAVDRPHPDDSHPTRGDYAREADRDDLLRWARAARGSDPRVRAVRSLYIAAARGPDFTPAPRGEP